MKSTTQLGCQNSLCQAPEILASSGSLNKVHIRVPTLGRRSPWRKAAGVLAGSVLSPAYWILAHRYNTPGLELQLNCARLGLHLLARPSTRVAYKDIYRMLFRPMDSTRYFEFDFMWEALSRISIGRYLDVSSPRLFPIMLALKKRDLLAELLNPDTEDLAATAGLVEALGLESRCRVHSCLITAALFAPRSFHVITSISVVEHIPQDTQAVQKMWELLTSGGRLLLTLPCAAEASEQYIDQDSYGLLTPDEDGFYFFQRLYDQQLLETRIFPVTGRPCRQVIYGEKVPGTLRRNLDRKMSDPSYTYWREPYMMGQDFSFFRGVSNLPGEGVIGLEFQKK